MECVALRSPPSERRALPDRPKQFLRTSALPPPPTTTRPHRRCPLARLPARPTFFARAPSPPPAEKNAPFLYDVVLTHLLDWPSLTCQWLPDKRAVADGDYNEHKLILGTLTSDSAPNSLCIATVRLPSEDTEIDARKYDEARGELGGYGGAGAKIEVSVRITHEGEVNRARHCPQNPFLIATKTPGGDVLVFDYSKHPSKPADETTVRPAVRCKGHTKEGWGLDWNPGEAGRLLSGSDDRAICVWDVASAGSACMRLLSTSSGCAARGEATPKATPHSSPRAPRSQADGVGGGSGGSDMGARRPT